MLTKLKRKIPRSVFLGLVRTRQAFLRFEDNGFPDPDKVIASTLAIGGPITAERLLEGVRIGAVCMFPRWTLPKQRGILFPDRLSAPRRDWSRIRNRGGFRLTMDQAFEQVVLNCADRPITHMTPALINAYQELGRKGHAHSVETWNQNNTLVGGLFGIGVGRVFRVISMFRRENDASKIAFFCLVRHLERWGYAFLDLEYGPAYMMKWGASVIDRSEFACLLEKYRDQTTPEATWVVDNDLALLTPHRNGIAESVH